MHADHASALSCLTPAPGCPPSLPPIFLLAISSHDAAGDWTRACNLAAAPGPLPFSCFLCTSTLQPEPLAEAAYYEQPLAPLAAFPPDGMFNGPCISDPFIRLFLANSPSISSVIHWLPPPVCTAACELLKPLLGFSSSK